MLSRSPRQNDEHCYVTPASPPESQRSREVSWSSVYVTPYKAAAGRGPNGGQPILGGNGSDQPLPAIFAPASTQRSAKRYCGALLVAAVAVGAFWTMGSPILRALLGTDWKWLALARFVIGVGGVLPSASLFRSVRVYVRAALHLRALLWLLLLPALWLVLKCDVIHPLSLRRHYAPAACDAVFVALALCVLLLDAAAAAVTSACGSPDGFRLERQLLSEYSRLRAAAPPRRPPAPPRHQHRGRRPRRRADARDRRAHPRRGVRRPVRERRRRRRARPPSAPSPSASSRSSPPSSSPSAASPRRR